MSKQLKYVGPVKNGKFDGIGRIVSKDDKIIYEGEFFEGRYEGKGKLINFLTKCLLTRLTSLGPS